MIALTFGMAAYTVNDAFVKLVVRELPFGEVLFLRGVCLCLIFLVAITRYRSNRGASIASVSTPLSRGARCSTRSAQSSSSPRS